MTTPQVTNVFSSKSDVAYHELRRLILTGALAGRAPGWRSTSWPTSWG